MYWMLLIWKHIFINPVQVIKQSKLIFYCLNSSSRCFLSLAKKVSIAPIWARFIQFITLPPETSISSRKNGNRDEKMCVCVRCSWFLFSSSAFYWFFNSVSLILLKRGSEMGMLWKDFYTVSRIMFLCSPPSFMLCFAVNAHIASDIKEGFVARFPHSNLSVLWITLKIYCATNIFDLQS